MKKLYVFLLAVATTYGSTAQVNFSIGATVPDFTVTDLDGVEHNLYDYTASGKYVLVDFYAYWCGPCMQYAPFVNDFYHKYGCNEGSLIVIGVEYEGTIEQCHGFEESAGINNANPFPVCSGLEGGGAAVHAAYGASAFPTYIAITPENVLLDNDIWPMGADPVATLESAFPDGSLVEMECGTVSVNESEVTSSFNLSPNPANAVAFINANVVNEMSKVNVLVYDATGKLVIYEQWNNLTSGSNRFQLNTSLLRAGLYTVQLVNENTTVHSERLVIQ